MAVFNPAKPNFPEPFGGCKLVLMLGVQEKEPLRGEKLSDLHSNVAAVIS